MSLIGKEKRRIYFRKIKGFWEEFRRNRVGFAGLAILAVFVAGGIFAPYLTPYNPIYPPRVAGVTGVAAPFAMPAWMAIFPQYKDLPRTTLYTVKDATIGNSSFINVTKDESTIKFEYKSNGHREEESILLSTEIDFKYAPPPPEFWFEYIFNVMIKPKYGVKCSIELFIKSETENPSWEKYVINSTHALLHKRILTRSFSQVTLSGSSLSTETRKITFSDKEPLNYMDLDPAKIIFSERQKYELLLVISFKPLKDNANSTVELDSGGGFQIMGELHGLLGTDAYRRDVFAELVYGIRISLVIGILSALLSTILGILFGVIAGYAGGVLDETLMRIIDVLLCLPVLPLLIILIHYYKPNIYFIVVLIAIFGWQGLSRIIRSRVLALREMPFVECAKASGAANSYIVFRHIIPNVIPVAMAAMILSVPSAILTEAALSFIGFGDPNYPTWGRMLHNAHTTGAFSRLAWWYAVPPGIAMTLLCLGFVFIGHAVDEIVNPRLRRRR